MTPTHHHTSDHFVIVVSGEFTLTVDGHEHALGRGSCFSLAGKASHVAKVVGSDPAVMLIQADGAWDVVVRRGDFARPTAGSLQARARAVGRGRRPPRVPRRHAGHGDRVLRSRDAADPLVPATTA